MYELARFGCSVYQRLSSVSTDGRQTTVGWLVVGCVWGLKTLLLRTRPTSLCLFRARKLGVATAVGGGWCLLQRSKVLYITCVRNVTDRKLFGFCWWIHCWVGWLKETLVCGWLERRRELATSSYPSQRDFKSKLCFERTIS